MTRGKSGTKIKKPSKTAQELRAEEVAAKAASIGAVIGPASQGGTTEEPFRRNHELVRVPLRDANGVTTETTLLNRGGTAVDRWHRDGQLTDLQVKAIEHVQGVWERAATVGGLVFDPLKIPGSSGGDGLAQQEALDDLARYRRDVPGRYWDVFEAVCRWDEPAGTAGSRLATNSRAALASARLCVAFVADLVAMWRGISA